MNEPQAEIRKLRDDLANRTAIVQAIRAQAVRRRRSDIISGWSSGWPIGLGVGLGVMNANPYVVIAFILGGIVLTVCALKAAASR